MATENHHITVCICTFKRAELLTRLLEKLNAQTTGDLFTYSVVVADNDSGRSAEPVVAKISPTARMPIAYCVEPQQNIALVRNRAIEHAGGDLIAFIDDDEFPVENWLLSLLTLSVRPAPTGCWVRLNRTSIPSRRNGCAKADSSTGPTPRTDTS